MTDSTPRKKRKTEPEYVSFSSSNLMLAHTWDAKQYQPQDFLMSEKLDGMRALWDGRKLVSRGGNKIHAPKFFIDKFPTHVALDGELFAGRGQFKKTVSIARRHDGGNLWRSLKFIVFDAPSVPGGFESRLAQAKTATSHLEFVEIHPHIACRDLDHLTEELQRVEKLDGEGLMMRKKMSPYHHGRSKDLLKVKTFKDDEAIVYAHAGGNGKHMGRMGALLCRLRSGVEFKVGSGFSDKERKNPPVPGTVITFRYFEFSQSSGRPRFPVFVRIRSDMNEADFLGQKKKPMKPIAIEDDDNDQDDDTPDKKNEKPTHEEEEQVEWQYWVGDGVDGKGTGWHDYTNYASTKAEQIYQAYQNNDKSSKAQLKIGPFTYLLDLQNMTQTNVTHSNHTTRSIRRCSLAVKPLS